MFHTLLKHISVSVYIVVFYFVFIIQSFCAAFNCEINYIYNIRLHLYYLYRRFQQLNWSVNQTVM